MLSQIVITGTRSYNTYPPLADINPQDSNLNEIAFLPLARIQMLGRFPFYAVAATLVLRLGGGRAIVETTYFALLLAPLKCPRLSTIRTRWEIVRACIFCMTAAL
jgi:hypothetical protein